MKQLAEDIWTHEDSMSLAGAPLRLRMTVIKLDNGGLWVHSPTALSPHLKDQIEQLGSVDFIVAASNGHNIWLREWQSAYPKAAIYVSGKIPNKLKLENYQLLDAPFDNIWEKDLAHEYMTGVPFFNESVFLHKKTQSLIVTDFIQNHSDSRPTGFAGMITRFVFEPMGFKGICLAPPLKISFVIKDKQGFSSFVKRINKWEFNRIVVTHGDIIESNAKKVFMDLCKRFIS